MVATTICDPPCSSGHRCREGHRTKSGKFVAPKCVPITKKKPRLGTKTKIPLKHPLETGSLKKLFGGKMQYDAKSCYNAGVVAKKQGISSKVLNGKFMYLHNVNERKNVKYAQKVEKCRVNAIKGFKGLK
jgi:hypothetical protein